MENCTNCGAGLGPGRFCTNCGTPVDPASAQAPSRVESDAEKTAVRMPAVQPDAATGTRYPLYAAPAPLPQEPTAPPLFADEVPTRAPEQTSASAWQSTSPQSPESAPWQETTRGAGPPVEPVGSHRSDEQKRSPLPRILLLLLAIVLAAGIGIWLGNRGDDTPDTRSSDSPGQSASQTPSTKPTPTPSDKVPDDADAVDLASRSTATGPSPRRPGTDVNGKKVSYPLSNMFDGTPSTAYRIAGDASGKEITFTLPEKATISEVGLINGYAKMDPGANWYDRNRKITKVEWIFDDGTRVDQDLRETTDMQVIGVDDAVTSTITMRIISVTKHSGPPLWNVTAISDVVLRGTAQ